MSRPVVLLDARKARDFGIGTYITSLAGELAARDDIELALVRRPDDGVFLPRVARERISDAPNYSLRELWAVRRAIGAVAPAVFHAPHYVAPPRPPAPMVVTVHDLMHLRRPEHDTPLKRLYAGGMLRRAVREAARVITVSEATRRDLVAFDPAADGKTVVIPNGVGSRFLLPVSGAERERVRHPYALDGPYVLFLGNDKPHKNLAGLLDALAALHARGEPARLTIAGGAAERAGARRAAIAARGLTDLVSDLGVVPAEDVPPLLAEASALAMPSLDEGFGIPVLEAQAVGTPVVCSARGGLGEASGGDALSVDPENPAEIADALARLLRDASLRGDLARRGQARAARFTWAAAAEATAAVYREVARVGTTA